MMKGKNDMLNKKSRNKNKAAKSDNKEKKSIGKIIKQCLLGGFHTFFIVVFIYFIILFCTVMTPQILAYVLGGLGFGGNDIQSGAVLIVSLMAGFFLTAWIFVISFAVIRFCWKIYVSNMRKCLPKNIVSKIDSIFHAVKNENG